MQLSHTSTVWTIKRGNAAVNVERGKATFCVDFFREITQIVLLEFEMQLSSQWQMPGQLGATGIP